MQKCRLGWLLSVEGKQDEIAGLYHSLAAERPATAMFVFLVPSSRTFREK